MLNLNMKNESKLIGAAIASIMLFSVFGSIGLAFADDELPEEIPDYGEFWSLTIHMIFAGADAETIEWDFGDGSPVSTEWNPSHTYNAPGDYIVKQTVWNSFEGGSSDVGYYLIHVMGDPFVEIIQPEGAPGMDRIYTPIRTAPERPDNPVWEGYTFVGWFADAEYTVLFDWDEPITEPVTVYTGWSGYAPIYHTLKIKTADGITISTIMVQNGVSAVEPVPPVGKIATYYVDDSLTEEFNWEDAITEDIVVYCVISDAPVSDESESGDSANVTEIVLIGSGILLLLAGLTTRRPGAVIISLIVLATATLGVYGIIQIPDIFELFRRV